jgi:ribosomal protein S18 acetylase RimI-like enzyme
MSDDISIRKGTIVEVVLISNEISEFDKPHDASMYKERLLDKDYLILVAEVVNQLVGFKVGYDKFQDGTFYTWMGGVKKEYRRNGIAKALATHQEDYAKSKGYDSIILKTRNRHKEMLIFALKSGFEIIEVLTMNSINEHRIILKKQLN